MTTHDYRARAILLGRENAGLRNRIDHLVAAVRRVERGTTAALPDNLEELFQAADYAASAPATDDLRIDGRERSERRVAA